ncbi:DUF2877 domain-containing protein [Sporosarcina soli]|uniref:DUF2877 domain-containing protein n=1 Tax=Sporosarcina soli TaxID=334736 RepID=A0ABW0THM9_9BACL
MFDSMDRAFGNHNEVFGLTVPAASEDVSRILDKNPKGKIHSVFTNSFNLAFGEELIHVGAVENGLAPFGMGLDQATAKHLTKLMSVNQAVYWDKRSMSIILPGGIFLLLSQVKWTDHRMRQLDGERSYLKDNFEFVASRLLKADWQTGLAETEEEKKRIVDYLLDSSSSDEGNLVLEKLESLQKLVSHPGDLDAKQVFDYWIGRGLGLTPSGDDCITGICAALSALEGTDQTFRQQLKSYLAEHGRKRTTHIALEYLLYATENKFHSHLLELCYVMDKPRGTEFLHALEEMKKMGHTSGTDTLVGVLMGIKAAVLLKKRKEG